MGFDFDEAFDVCAKIAQPVIPLGDGWQMTTLMGKEGARALVTEALEAARDSIADYKSQWNDGTVEEHHLAHAMFLVRRLIPKPPAPPDPQAEYVKRLEGALGAVPCNCGYTKNSDGYHKDWCFEQVAYEVLASKPKEAT